MPFCIAHSAFAVPPALESLLKALPARLDMVRNPDEIDHAECVNPKAQLLPF